MKIGVASQVATVNDLEFRLFGDGISLRYKFPVLIL